MLQRSKGTSSSSGCITHGDSHGSTGLRHVRIALVHLGIKSSIHICTTHSNSSLTRQGKILRRTRSLSLGHDSGTIGYNRIIS